MLRIATIGTSMITDNLIEALAASGRAVFAGTLSRDADRARAFTLAHGGDQPFTSVDELAAADDVDAVYIGSPNALHARQAIELARAGKHVLVEKSFAANRAEAERVFAAAEEAGVVALEAMRPLHDPAFSIVREHVRAAGRMRRATIRFGKYSSRYDDLLAGSRTNIFDCRMASGSLMDLGIYCIEPMIALFGEPERVLASSVLLDESTHGLTAGPIDGAGSVLASYPGMVVELAWSKISNDGLPVQFESEDQTLTLDSISIPTDLVVAHRGETVRGDAKSAKTDLGGTVEHIELPRVENTMVYELEDFISAIEAVRGGAEALEAQAGPYGTVADFREATLAALAVADEVRRQSGVRFPADDLEGSGEEGA